MQLFSVFRVLMQNSDTNYISHGYISNWNSQRDISPQVSFSKRYEVENSNSHKTNH